MNNVTFRECRKYIEALKIKPVTLGVKGHEVEPWLGEDLADKVVIATSKKKRVIVVSTAEGLLGFHFDENVFLKEEIVSSWDEYLQEFYNFSIFQVDPQKLLLYLRANEKSLTTIHEEINFELGLRLRKTFMSSPEVVFVIYYWQNGPMLLCNREGENDIFSMSEARQNVIQEEALETIRAQHRNEYCSMLVLRSGSGETPLPSDSDLLGNGEEEEMMVVDVDIPLPEEVAQSSDEERGEEEEDDSQLLSKKFGESTIIPLEAAQLSSEKEIPASRQTVGPNESEGQKLGLEDSVVIRDEELPELGPQDMDIYQKYGIEPPRFVLQEETEIPLDQSVPSLNDKELGILTKYGIALSEKEQPTCRQIREAFEESVILTDEDLPPIGPDDATILKKYGIVLQEKKKSPLVTPQDVLVFKKYGIKLPKGERSSQEDVRKAYNLAVAIKKVSDNIAIKDREIFEKFGLKVARKPFYQNLKLSYVVVPVLVVLMIIVGSIAGSHYRSSRMQSEKIDSCKESLARLERYQAELTQSKEALRQVLGTLARHYPSGQGYPEPPYAIVEKVKEVEAHIPQVSQMIEKGKSLLQNEEIVEAVEFLNPKNVDSHIKPEYLSQINEKYEAAQKILKNAQNMRQDRIDFCNKQLLRVKEYADQLLKEVKNVHKILNTLSTTYPPQQGYPEPNPKILKELESVELHIAALLDIQQEGKEFLTQEDFNKGVAYVNKEKVDRLLSGHHLAELKKIQNRLQNTLNMAQFMDRQRADQMDIRKASRMLREHIMAYYQKVRTLEENWKFLKERYPEDKGFPPAPKGGEKLIQETAQQIGQLKKSLSGIETEVLNDNIARAISLSKPFLNLASPDVSSLDAMNGSVSDALHLCQKMELEKTGRRQGLHLLLSLGKTVDGIQQELDEIKDGIKVLETFPSDLNVPRPDLEYRSFVGDMEKQVNELRDSIQQGRNLLYQNQIQQSLALLEPLGAKTFSLQRLQEAKENVKDAVLIAKSMEKRSAMGKEISDLLQNTKNKLIQLENVSEVLENQVSSLAEKYPPSKGFPKSEVNYEPVLEKSRGLKKRLKGILKRVDGYLAKKSLEEGLGFLKKYSGDATQAGQMVPTISELSRALEKNIEQCEQIARERHLMAQVESDRAKIKEYQRELEEQLTPLNQNVKRLKEEFPASEGYKEAPEEVHPILQRGNKLLDQIKEVLSEGESLIQKKAFAKAQEHFDLSKTGRLLDRDMVSDLGKYRYRIDDILYESIAMGERKSKVLQIKNILEELRERQGKLKSVLNAYTVTLEILRKDFAGKEFVPIDKYADEALNEGKYELKELEKVVGDGEEYLHSGEYDKVLMLIKPYSHTVNPGVSKLSFVQGIYNNLQRALDQNRKMIDDPTFKDQVERKLAASKEKGERREKWMRSPGPWYDELSKYLAIYSSLESQVANSLKDQGAIFLFYKIKASMAELKQIPSTIADLEEVMFNIEQKNEKVEALLAQREKDAIMPNQIQQAKALKTYLSKRQVIIEAQDAMQNLHIGLNTLKEELKKGSNVWISKDLLKEVLKGIKPIEDRYKEEYEPINSMLINMEASLPR